MDVPGMRVCDLEGCEKPHRARGLCATHYKHVHGRGDRYEDVPCAYCGTVVRKKVRSDHKIRYCSSLCQVTHQSSQQRVRWAARRSAGGQLVRYEGDPFAPRCEVPVTHQSRRRSGLTTGGRTVFVSGSCVRCGRTTTSRVALGCGYEETFNLTCSRTCTKRLQRDKRRAVKKAAFVEKVYRYKVYARDSWICQLCGDPVVREAKVPHPLAPTIDHIVPLSPYLDRPGGEHSMANVQTAHFLCNARKSHFV